MINKTTETASKVIPKADFCLRTEITERISETTNITGIAKINPSGIDHVNE